jgi:serpin B
MNALYFKAKWANETLFKPNMTLPRDFTRKDGNKVKVNMMAASEYLPYGKFDGFQAVGIPYANGKYSMYILLPDAGTDFEKWVAGLDKKDFSAILDGMKKNLNVELRLPKFDVSGDFLLNDILYALGVRKAFTFEADFSPMFQNTEDSFRISRVIQKAKLSLAEWGTEAAAVTVIEIEKATAVGPGAEAVKFYADRPFVFVLAENTSRAILFEGVYQGD